MLLPRSHKHLKALQPQCTPGHCWRSIASSGHAYMAYTASLHAAACVFCCGSLTCASLPHRTACGRRAHQGRPGSSAPQDGAAPVLTLRALYTFRKCTCSLSVSRGTAISVRLFSWKASVEIVRVGGPSPVSNSFGSCPALSIMHCTSSGVLRGHHGLSPEGRSPVPAFLLPLCFRGVPSGGQPGGSGAGWAQAPADSHLHGQAGAAAPGFC